MNIEEFLRLVGTVEISDNHDGLYPEAGEIGMYHSYIPLDAFIAVMQNKGLEVKKKKITTWSLASDLAEFTRYFGTDEAHDVIMGILRKYMPKKYPSKKIKPVCAQDIIIEEDCIECKSDIDCGGKEARESVERTPSSMVEALYKKTKEDQEKYKLK